ncbi:MAG: arsenate reductase ArsC [Deltaproteobacteria bacterium]|nr:arsenate reductase ArsC [Deltaproteobacteria bacterium]
MSVSKEKKRVLFICTHNAARSQMAEGLVRALYGNRYEVFSAGTDTGIVSPFAIKVMAEIGLDISSHYSKSIQEFSNQSFDYVVTVCDHAKESCPFFPGGKKILHQSFEDPSSLTGTEEEIMAGFRRVRNAIRSWIENEFSKM